MATTTRQEIAGLGKRGKALYKELHADGKEYPALTEVLVVEACRIADRLDRLNQISSGETQDWVHFKERDGENVVIVYVDSLLGELRHQATTLKQLVAEITKTDKPADKPKPEANPLDDFAARRAARRAAATG